MAQFNVHKRKSHDRTEAGRAAFIQRRLGRIARHLAVTFRALNPEGRPDLAYRLRFRGRTPECRIGCTFTWCVGHEYRCPECHRWNTFCHNRAVDGHARLSDCSKCGCTRCGHPASG